jgi:hypothetical protein
MRTLPLLTAPVAVDGPTANENRVAFAREGKREGGRRDGVARAVARVILGDGEVHRARAAGAHRPARVTEQAILPINARGVKSTRAKYRLTIRKRTPVESVEKRRAIKPQKTQRSRSTVCSFSSTPRLCG